MAIGMFHPAFEISFGAQAIGGAVIRACRWLRAHTASARALSGDGAPIACASVWTKGASDGGRN
jgi:hypothetical protein